jgi:uncharacterized protein
MTNSAVTAVDLGRDECLRVLGTQAIGRLCVVEDGYPVAFPVNYRLVYETNDKPVIVVRARQGGVLDVSGSKVGFQIDGHDALDETGWSVLARGVLCDGLIEGAPQWLRFWNPRPWAGPRDQWLYMPVEEITGRRLLVPVAEFAIRVTGYL